MATKNKQGEWKDGRGNFKPISKVRPIDRERDRTVEGIFQEIEMLEQEMKRKKDQILGRIEDYKALAEEEYNSKFSETGAIQLTTYDATKQVEVRINNIVKYDEKAQLAENILKERIREWTEGANKNLIAIVDEAFELDHKGNLSHSKLATLRRLDIQDKEWKRGIDLLTEAQYAAGSRQYIMVRERPNPDEKFQSKSLNFSTI